MLLEDVLLLILVLSSLQFMLSSSLLDLVFFFKVLRGFTKKILFQLQ